MVGVESMLSGSVQDSPSTLGTADLPYPETYPGSFLIKFWISTSPRPLPILKGKYNQIAVI
jgi:hypothetical protein